MGDLDALRTARGAGRVDHVCEIPGTSGALRVGAGRLAFVLQEDLAGDARQSRGQACLCQRERGARILQLESEAIARRRRVERQVGRSGFQDSEKSRHHAERPFGAEADQDFRTGSLSGQAAGDAVRPAIQLPVRQLPAVHREGDGVRGPLRLGLEEPMDAFRPGIARRPARLREQPAPLLRVHQRQRGNARVRIGDDRHKQRPEMPGHPRNRGRLEEIAPVLDPAIETVGLLPDLESQIEAGRRDGRLPGLDGQAGQLEGRPRRVLKHEQEPGKGHAAGGPLRREKLDELSERNLLVSESPESGDFGSSPRRSRRRSKATGTCGRRRSSCVRTGRRPASRRRRRRTPRNATETPETPRAES